MNQSTPAVKMAHQDPTALLNIKQLSINVGNQRLVDRVSLKLAAGQVLALVGESGSGKSLTSLAVMRLLDDALAITEGEILLNGVNLLPLTESEMTQIRGRQIAMIFQEPQTSLNAVKTIGAQIGEVIALHQPKVKLKQRQQKVIALLDEVGIPDPEQRYAWYPHQLSGGQKQRVMIAMALACEPQLLIADEPTTALDVTIQKQILDLLKAICQRRQLGILFITHDMGVVAATADHIAVMRQGLIVEQNSCEQFFAKPQHDYSRDLIAALPNQDNYFAAQEVSQKPLLDVRHLKVWFAQRKGLLQRTVGHTKAVDDISLQIFAGETLALVGESGSGKSTVGRAILNLLDITDGEIFYRQQAISGLSQKAFKPLRRDIQVIFQDPYASMNPRFTVRQIIAEGMQSLGTCEDPEQRQQQITELLLRVGLEEQHLDRYPHEFSGGQRQRIAIARALAVKPKLIICDEPTSALDVSIRSQVLDLLQELQRELGISYLFITHDLSIIPRLAHRVAVMKQGQLVEYNTAQQVMTAPQHSYTQQLLAAVPHLPNKKEAAPAVAT